MKQHKKYKITRIRVLCLAGFLHLTDVSRIGYSWLKGYIYLVSHALNLFSSRNSWKTVGKSYLSQRTRMSQLVTEETLIYTLIQFVNIIYLVLGKLLIFLTALKE